ncbi:MAG: LytTR family DNA-binding domain-containing protein [Bacilli bacterium]|nr:LytTR family transcriptional regulator [Acholeplasmataceae bacterium]
MKLNILEDKNQKEIEIDIRCPKIDDKINKLANIINTYYFTIQGKKDDVFEVLQLDNIYYFESVENKVFAYLPQDVYEVNFKINELASMLESTSFIQVAKPIVLNINKIKKIKPLVNGRMLAILDNEEKVVITRVYAQAFKKKLNV